MTYWNLLVIIACTGLLVFLIWKEIKRPHKIWLQGRIVASIGAVAGLAGMALPFTYSKYIAADNSEVLLLTDGYQWDSVASFLDKNKMTKVFTLVKERVPGNSIFLPDAIFLNNDTNYFTALHVFGNGLNEDELTFIHNIPFTFHPSVTPQGIDHISWNRHIVSGEKLMVQGRFTNEKRQEAKLVLEGFGVRLDSCIIPTGRSAHFQLQTEPKHLDRAVYSIIAVVGKDTIANEPLPVEVTVPKPVSILLLAAYPDFENKFLKNWLAQSSYPVAMRTRISKDKFVKEYSNLPGVSINSIDGALLKHFDVVVADAAELADLSRPELVALQTAISRQGTGLLIKADSGMATGNFYGSLFPLMQERSSVPVLLQLQAAGDTTATYSMLKTVQPAYIRPVPGTQPLLQTAGGGQTVVSSKLQGIGKIVMTTLHNTFTWQLAGKEDAYTRYWSMLLQQAAKNEILPEAFTIASVLPVVDEKTTIQLQTTFPEPPQMLAGNTVISMEQNYQLPFLWQGYYWPQKEGWVSLSTSHQTHSWFYTFSKNDWQIVRAERKKRITQNAATASPAPVQHSISNNVVLTEIPKVYFLLLFLLPASFLWFEKKYHSV